MRFYLLKIPYHNFKNQTDRLNRGPYMIQSGFLKEPKKPRAGTVELVMARFRNFQNSPFLSLKLHSFTLYFFCNQTLSFFHNLNLIFFFLHHLPLTLTPFLPFTGAGPSIKPIKPLLEAPNFYKCEYVHNITRRKCPK